MLVTFPENIPDLLSSQFIQSNLLILGFQLRYNFILEDFPLSFLYPNTESADPILSYRILYSSSPSHHTALQLSDYLSTFL